MSQLLNKIVLTLCAIFLNSCGFIDFREIKVDIEPELKDFILPQQYSPVIIRFDTEMVKKETESILSVSSDAGIVAGDKTWKDNALYFTPVNGWNAGVRYMLSLYGMMRSADGREFRVEKYNYFYAINNNEMPIIESFSPNSGESVSVKDFVLELNFSQSMDRLSVETAFSLEGVSNKKFEWLNEDKTFRVIPEKDLSPWVMYKWSVRNTARSADGVQLSKNYSEYFITDIDQQLPAVTRIYPVLNADGLWYPTGLDIANGLGQGHGIAVEFSKPMSESVLSSIRFEPSLSGRAEYLSEKSIVYIFSKAPEPQIEYTLIVSGDVKDREGLKLGEDYRINFIPDIPSLEVLSIKIDDNVFNVNNLEEKVIKINIDKGNGYLNISIRFSLMFDHENKINIPQRITLSPYFPRTLSPVAVQYVNWNADDRLFLRWEGLTPTQEEPYFYKLLVPGGKNGINSSSGVYMKKDLIIYLEVVK